MNAYVTLSCLMAVVGLSHGSAIGGYGYGGLGWGGYGGLGGYGGWGGVGVPIIKVAPAVSTANLIKAAPIPVIKTVAAPVITTPVISGLGWGGLGYGGLGYGGLGGKGLLSVNTWGYGLGKGYGWGGYGHH